MPEEAVNIFEPPAYALVIGINTYGDEKNFFPDLKCSQKDAADFATFLKENGFFKNNVITIPEAEADRKTIINKLEQLAEWCFESEEDPLVMIFFSGHGCMRKKLGKEEHFLIPHGADNDDLRNTAIDNTLFMQLVNQIQSNRLIVFLDACHSAGIADDSGRKGSDTKLTQYKFDDEEELGKGKGRYIITSSMAGESSWERKDGTNGIFTRHLIDLLNNPDDVPALRDKEEINIIDFYPVLRQRVSDTATKERKESQLPTKYGDDAEGIIIAINKKAKERKQSKKLLEFLYEVIKIIDVLFPNWKPLCREVELYLDNHINNAAPDKEELKEFYPCFHDEYIKFIAGGYTTEEAARLIKHFYEKYRAVRKETPKKPSPVEKPEEAAANASATPVVSGDAVKQMTEGEAADVTISPEKPATPLSTANTPASTLAEGARPGINFRSIKAILQPLTDKNYDSQENTLYECLSNPKVSEHDFDACIQQLKNENANAELHKILDEEVMKQFKKIWLQLKIVPAFTSIASLRNFETQQK